MNPNKPFFPITEDIGTDYQGISTRDYIAIEVMKKLIPDQQSSHKYMGDYIPYIAYKYADALIAESNKK